MAAKMAATKMSSATEVFIGGEVRGFVYAGVLLKMYSLTGGANMIECYIPLPRTPRQ